MAETQEKRIRDELKAVGVGSIGLLTPESKGLARILHPDEHIGGVVYGLYSGGLAWLIATDQRVIFLDRKPFYTSTDELTYDVVSGVVSTRAGLFVAIVLRTRINTYSIRFVNPKSARIFVDYIETRRLEGGHYDHATFRHTPADKPPPPPPPVFQNTSDEALNFLKAHDLAVLSTVDRTGNVHGAVVYYLVDQNNNFVYILTKSGTGKGRNVYAHGQVALTVHEAGTVQTVQLQGFAEVETDQATKDSIFAQIVKPRPYRGEMQLPPVTKLHEGAFMVIKIAPTFISLHDYAKIE
jgi:general stress protein 26